MYREDLMDHFDPSVLDQIFFNATKQLDIVTRLIAGESYRSIGNRWGISTSTVRYFKLQHFPTVPNMKHTNAGIGKVNAERKRANDIKRRLKYRKIKEMIGQYPYREIALECECSVGLVGKVSAGIYDNFLVG